MSPKNYKNVICTVTGHDNGPLCPKCKKPTDTVKIDRSPNGRLDGEVAHYCSRCVTPTTVVPPK